jgi:hypothetical protein
MTLDIEAFKHVGSSVVTLEKPLPEPKGSRVRRIDLVTPFMS